ncbi:glycosyltransferase [Cohnella sp. GCM10027633]|uniref:glycosyltransferase n=1 Tax=unclassified Cohnella TaxID=2636738 RepID=UPI003632FF29
MKILIACSDFPYPANHGARVDTWGRIMALSELGWTIGLVVCGKEKPSEADLRHVGRYVDEIKLCPRSSSLSDLLHAIPMQASSRLGLRHADIEGDYDYVLLEGDYVYPILDHPKIRQGRAILRVHNDEAAYFKALARSTRNVLHKLYYRMESRKFERLRRMMRRKIDKYLFISSKEFESFRSKDASAHSLFLPPPVTMGKFGTNAFESKRVVFIGSLFMPNNREAIEWYLARVHPEMLGEPGYEFVVAGNSKRTSLSWLEPYDLTNVVVIDSPESLDDIYESGYLFVNPMQNGAGVKLKTIEAIQNGLPVLSTSIGCEGTGLARDEHIALADTPEEFRREIKRLLRDPKAARALLEQSQRYLREHYNHKEALRGFIASIDPDYPMKQVM